MVIFIIALIVIFNIEKCSAYLSFVNKIKKMMGKEAKDKNVKGIFKSVIYLGSIIKIPCFGKKYPPQSYGRQSWYHSGKRISSNDHYRTDKYGTLAIFGVSVDDSGEFICRMNSKSVIYEFKHDVIVLQFPSRSLHIHFVYTVRLCTRKSEEFAAHFIESKVKKEVCSENECILSFIHSSCHFEEFANPVLKVTVPILIPGIPNKICNVECLRRKTDVLKEEVKHKVIAAVMHGQRLKIREEPQEMSISYLETKEDNICDPGYEMKGTISKSICFPCPPGQFLERGYCIPCHLNYYNGRYAQNECHSCFGSRVTRSRGSTTEDECYLADPEVLWILLAIFVITITILLICCCWSVIKVLGESTIGKCFDTIYLIITCNGNLFRWRKHLKSTEEKSSKDASKTRKKSKRNTKQAPDVISLQTKAGPTDSSHILPSVRHSSGKDFVYRPKRPVNTSAVPPPPALPTDSMLKQAARNMTYHVVDKGRINKSETKSEEKVGSKTTEDRTVTKSADILPIVTDDDVPRFSERVLKNKPMYNAIMKSKA